MAKRSFNLTTYTPSALADTVNLTNAAYQAISATGALIGLNVLEIYIGGQASASSVNIAQFARTSIIGQSGASALVAPNSDGPLIPYSNSAAATVYTASSVLPQRSAAITSARLSLSMNSFGGIVRWVAAPGEEWGIFGQTVNISESVLSCFTGGTPGLVGSHIIYEPA